MEKKFFIDMDGVIARWDTSSSVEDTYKKDYFRKLNPESLLIEVVLDLVKKGYEVSILSHVYNAIASEEKTDWLKQNGLGSLQKVFVPVGEAKHNFIPNNLNCVNILVDDYTKNLNEWEKNKENNIGIKVYNGINGSKGTWKGLSINLSMSLNEIVELLTNLYN